MAFTRSNAFNADMNQDLLNLVQGFQYKPYGVRATSGYRPGDPRQHGRGTALDVELLDPKTQTALENYQDPSTFGAYQQYANALYQHALQSNPDLAQKLRWGGYFSGGKGKYGALDLMHFDVGGGGMGGGSWQGGLTPEQAALWGLQPGGGISGGGMGPAQPSQNYGYGPEQRRNAIAAIESAGSGDYGAVGPVTNRQGNRAYGRYQVMASNIPSWTKQALGVEMTPEQFLASKEAQDKVFDTIFGGYAQKYGERGAASMWFTGRPNEPDVKDVLGTTGKGYVDKYMAALGQAPSTGPSASPAGQATVADQVADTTAPAADKAGKWDKFGKAIAKGVGGFGKAQAPVMGTGGNAPQLPAQAPLPMESMPIVAGGGDDQRNQLALLMQRLNTGSLWG